MAKETQKAKIERLEQELAKAHKVIAEQNKCINKMQEKANDSFANSNDKKQLEDKIKRLEMKLQSAQDGKKHAEKMAKAKDEHLQELLQVKDTTYELEQQIAELKSELEKGVHNSLSINEHKKVGRKEKFNTEQIEQIKQSYKNNKSYRAIAKEFNCSVGLVHKIINS